MPNYVIRRSPRFNPNKRVWCDICGLRFKWKDLRQDYNNMWVCADDWDLPPTHYYSVVVSDGKPGKQKGGTGL